MKIFSRKFLISIISILLVVCLLSAEPMHLVADNRHLYISDVRIASAKTASDAIKELRNAGYRVYDMDLMKNNGGNYVYLGYKTTTNKDEAITDLRMMNMNGGFNVIDYEKELSSITNERLNKTAAELKIACEELRTNISNFDSGNGCYFADLSRAMLQGFTYNNVSLDEYLLSTERTEQDFIRLVSLASSKTLTMLFYIVAIGLTDSSEDSFKNNIEKSGLFDVVANYEISSDDDALYLNTASEIMFTITTFAENYKVASAAKDKDKKYFEKKIAEVETQDDSENALLNTIKNDYEDENSNIDESVSPIIVIDEELADDPSYEQVSNTSDSIEAPDVAVAATKKEAETQDDEETVSSEHLNTLSTYEKLKTISTSNADTNNNLADWILKAAELYSDKTRQKDALRMLYPLIENLTECQITMLKLIGLENFVILLDTNTKANYDKLIGEFSGEYRTNKSSILSDVETDVYSMTVATTDSATRSKAAGNLYSALSKDNDSDAKTYMMKLQKYFAITLGVIAAEAITLGLLHFGISASLTQFVIVAAKLVSAILITKTITAATIGWLLGGISVVVLAAAVVAAVVILIVWLVNYIKEKKRNKQVTYTTIPDIIIDDPNGKFAKYYAVTNGGGKGSGVDLCDNKGTEWDVLYYTKSPNAGSPLEVYNGVAFEVNSSDVAPSKMTGVRRFQSEITTANFNRYLNNTGKYLFCYTSNSIEGKKDTTSSGGNYISDIKMVTKGTAQEARAALEAEDFILVDQNLTPGKEASYIGYKTTSVKSDAIRDIRVGFNLNANLETSVIYGDSGYAAAGTTTLKQTILFTKNASAGTPILASTGIKVLTNRNNAPNNYAPVNLFCGGDAFDFRYGCDTEGTLSGEQICLYFEPEYDSSFDNNTEYLSGFAFVTIDKNSDGKISSRQYEGIKACGFEIWKEADNFNIFNDTTRYYNSSTFHYNKATYIVISKTKNKYKALTDIWAHTTSVSATTVYTNINYGSIGYSACDLFYTPSNEFGTISPIKAYIINSLVDGASTFANEAYMTLGYNTPTEATIAKYNYNYSGRTHVGGAAPSKTIYVSGPCANKEPLKLSDIKLSRTSNVPDSGWRGVCNFGNSYETKAADLYLEVNYSATEDRETIGDECISEVKPSTHCYIFIHREQTTKPQYVSAVSVVSGSLDQATIDKQSGNDAKNAMREAMIKNLEEQTFFTALSKGEGVIDRRNLAVSESKQLYKEEENGKILRYNYTLDWTGKNLQSGYENCSMMFISYQNGTVGSLRDIMLVKASDAPTSSTQEIEYQLYDYVNNKPAVTVRTKIVKRKRITIEIPIKVAYKRCGALIKSSELGDYYLYYSINTMSGNEKSDVYSSCHKLEFYAKTARLFNNKLYLYDPTDQINEGSNYIHLEHATELSSTSTSYFAIAAASGSSNSKYEALDNLYNAVQKIEADPLTGKYFEKPLYAYVDYVIDSNFSIEGSESGGKYSYLGFSTVSNNKYYNVITALAMTTRSELDYQILPSPVEIYNPSTEKYEEHTFSFYCGGDLGSYIQRRIIDMPTGNKDSQGLWTYTKESRSVEYFNQIGFSYDKSLSTGVDIATVRFGEQYQLPLSDNDTEYERKCIEIMNSNTDLYLRHTANWSVFEGSDKLIFNSIYDVFMEGSCTRLKWTAAPYLLTTPKKRGPSRQFYYPSETEEWVTGIIHSPYYYTYDSSKNSKNYTLWYQTVESKTRVSEAEGAYKDLQYLLQKANGSVFGEGNLYVAFGVIGLLLVAAGLSIIKRKKIYSIINGEQSIL